VGLDDLITQFLTNDKREFQRYRSVQVLHLIVGDEYTQPIHVHVLDQMLTYRNESRFMTILSTRCFDQQLLQRFGNQPVFISKDTMRIPVPEELRD